MVFLCQRNCYKAEYISTVLSCEPSKCEITSNGTKEVIDCYKVKCEDTVFFPEGGGQPYDTGFIDNIRVLKVLREGEDAVHYLETPVEVGSSIKQVIDWDRRHDHMQQHSAQHLITAIADGKFSSSTTSWKLGATFSSIELQIPDFLDLNQLEEEVNECIRRALPVVIKEYDASEPELEKIRSRGLPDDVSGPIRVVSIEGIDSNLCCGTHVHNLSDLQVVKILQLDKGKGGKSSLSFVAGKRVLKTFGECLIREKELCSIFNTNPGDLLTFVQKSKKDLKQTSKSLRDASKRLALAEASLFKTLSPRPLLFCHHWKDGDMDYFGIIISEIGDQSVLKVLTSGEESGPGSLVIDGPQDLVTAVSQRVCEILDGKGGGKTRFSAKINRPSKRKEAEDFIRSFLSSNNGPKGGS